MKFNTAAAVDLYLGSILIRLLSFLGKPNKQLPAVEGVRSVLLIKFWGLGSIIEASPLVRQLRTSMPGAKLELLTFSSNTELSKHLELFHHVHGIDFHKGTSVCLRQLLVFLYKARGSYDLIIDLEFFSNASAVMTSLLNSSFSLGFDCFSSVRNSLYSRTLVFDHTCHVRTIFYKFLDALGLRDVEQDLTLTAPNLPEESKFSAMEKLPMLEESGPHVAMNINAGDMCLNRRWPLEKYLELTERLLDEFPEANIYLVGSPTESTFVNTFLSKVCTADGRVHNLAGQLDILEFCQVLGLMDCFLTNDSGPLHIAEALDVSSISFFGPESPNLYGPLSKDSVVFYKNMFCSPCINTYNNKKTKCRNNQCMKRISVDEVYAVLCNGFLGRA